MIVCWNWKHDPASDAGFSRIILLNGDKVKRMSKGVRAGKAASKGLLIFYPDKMEY